MTQKEIYDLENANNNKIYLYREGIFWKAYERSAFYLTGPENRLKPIKKFIKSVGEAVVSVGFPCAVEEKQIAKGDVLQREEKRMVVQVEPKYAPGDFAAWKEAIALHIPARERPATGKEAASGAAYAAPDNRMGVERIIATLRGFNVESHTPLECMLCLSELRGIAVEIQSVYDGQL